MNSPNIISIPLNPEGAMELGMCPCDGCHTGWANWGAGKDPKYCHSECGYWKKWHENQEIEL